MNIEDNPIQYTPLENPISSPLEEELKERIYEKENILDKKNIFDKKNIRSIYKKWEKFIVFFQGNNYLDSAIKFSQYIYDNRKLVTIIGEDHNLTFTCNQNPMSIAEYVKKIVMKNKNSKVLLEYNEGNNPLLINSSAISSTYKMLLKNNKSNHILPYDNRSYMLHPDNQNYLYTRNLTSLSPPSIRLKYIAPFMDRVDIDTPLFPNPFKITGNYPPSVVKYLFDIYLPSIKSNFVYIEKMLRAHNIKYNNITRLLRETWKKIADFYILAEIFREDTINEIIIIAGDVHQKHLHEILNKSLILTNQIGSPTNCIKLFETYTFYT